MSDGPHEAINVVDRAGDRIVSFRSKRLIDEMTIRDLGRDLLALAEGETGRLILNFQGVETIASTMLGKLITLDRKLRERGQRLVLCRLEPSLQDVFRVSNLDAFFPIHASEEEAIAAPR